VITGVGVGAPFGAGVTGWIVAVTAVADPPAVTDTAAVADPTAATDADGSGVGVPGVAVPAARRSPHAAATMTKTPRHASSRLIWV
jgi:hypothetical protein